MISGKTYWTFVVRLQSRMKLKSNRLLGTESVPKSNGSTHSEYKPSITPDAYRC